MPRAAAAFLLGVCILPASAVAALVPTLVNSGDCVADILLIPYSPERRPYDEQYCARGNPGNPAAAAVCMRNSALNDTRFFTDRCGDGSAFYLAVDGVEHTLKRVGPSWSQVNLSGRFAGDGFELEVLPLKDLSSTASPTVAAQPEDPDEAESGSWTVRITLSRGAEKRVFEATLLFGP